MDFRDLRHRLMAAALLSLGLMSPMVTLAECPHAPGGHDHDPRAAHAHEAHAHEAHDAHAHEVHTHAAPPHAGHAAGAPDATHADPGPEHCPMDEGETCSMYVPLPGGGSALPDLPHGLASAGLVPTFPLLSADPTGILRPPRV